MLLELVWLLFRGGMWYLRLSLRLRYPFLVLPPVALWSSFWVVLLSSVLALCLVAPVGGCLVVLDALVRPRVVVGLFVLV